MSFVNWKAPSVVLIRRLLRVTLLLGMPLADPSLAEA